MNGEAPHPPPVDDDPSGASSLAGVLLSLGAAVIAAGLVLRSVLDDTAVPKRAAVPPLPPAASPAIADTLLPLPPAEARHLLMLRPARATPEPWTFASIAEAGRRLGYPVLSPTLLPDGLFVQTVRWQLDSYVTAPGQAYAGVLQAWYASEEMGGVFMLEQGPAVGVSDFAAPEGASGTIQLPDGRRLIWVRGHRQRSDDSPGSGGWGGSELRLGVRAGSTRGWRLTTRSLSLDDLVTIAEGLR